MSGALAPRVYTIPAGAPFLGTVAEVLLDGTLVPGFSRDAGPLGLAAATIFVPTRRAARALAAEIAARTGTASTLLPRILPMGALDDAGTGGLLDEGGFDDPLAPDLPVAIGDVARRMILTRMILAWAAAVRRAIIAVGPDGTRNLHPDEEMLVATSPADAWGLAGDLAALNDELYVAGVDWGRIEPLGTDAFDQYWRITLDFLDIVIKGWPAILAERGEADRATRQVALVEAETARLGRTPPPGSVVVAGVTGVSPAAAQLIGTVARLPKGAVVLPGLDLDLDEASWAAVGAENPKEPASTHPQADLKRLLGAIGLARAAVLPIGSVAPGLLARGRFVSEALRPAETTDRWRSFISREGVLDRGSALEGVAVIEAGDERQEALAIAVALREALEGAGTAVLATPDRALGRRVREELARWSIEIDESGGEPLGTTPAGAFARLVLDCALSDLAPVEVLALLAHPLARFGRPRAEVARLARTLEIAILRGVLPPRALHDPAGLMARANALVGTRAAPDALRRLNADDLADLTGFVTEVVKVLAPLHDLDRGTPLPDWIDAHAAVLDAVAVDPDGRSVLTGIDGNALRGLFDALAEAPQPTIALDCPGYGALFDRWAAETPVRGPNRSHPRVKILGLLEARLLSADLMVLGGLDETVWPPAVQTDAFLNRPMRAALGLPSPERRIGQAAHDFQSAMGQRRVVLTRARKRGGSPTVPSRFLQRMAALAGDGWTACVARGDRYLSLAAALDRPAAIRTISQPAPRPPVELRPTRLSVTRIETLRRDPYAIYAERILKLAPAEAIGAVMGPAQHGTAFHTIIRDFTLAHPGLEAPADAVEDLLGRAETAFAGAADDPLFMAFTWPRVARWTRAFLAWESERRTGAPVLAVETRGELVIDLLDGSRFTLVAEADRIETAASGLVTILDFKTGAVPTAKEVQVGFAPQLTLEAAMAQRGAFPSLGQRAEVEGAAYVKFGTGATVEWKPLTWKDRTFADVVEEHYRGLIDLLNLFRNPATGYLARPYPQYAARYNAYDHLSRVKEWSMTGGVGSSEDGG